MSENTTPVVETADETVAPVAPVAPETATTDEKATPAARLERQQEKLDAQQAKIEATRKELAAKAEAEAEKAAALAVRTERAESLMDAIASDAGEMVAAFNSGSESLQSLCANLSLIQTEKLHKEAGHASYPELIAHVAKTYLQGLDGGLQKEWIRFVAAQLPGIAQRKLAALIGVSQSEVSRGVNGSTAGDGEGNHGGARQTKRAVTKVAAGLAALWAKDGAFISADDFTADEARQTTPDLWNALVASLAREGRSVRDFLVTMQGDAQAQATAQANNQNGRTGNNRKVA